MRPTALLVCLSGLALGATVALVNNMDLGDRFAAASLAKRIVGDPLP
jgi:hypothetical protein